MKKKLILLLLGLLLVLVPAAQAQENWYVFLFNGIERSLLRINGADGTQETFDLGLPEDTYLSAYDMAISADGSRAAYCIAGPQQTSLIMRNLAAGQDVLSQVLGQSMACRVGYAGLSSEGAQIAVGLVNYFPGDPNADSNQPVWRLLIVDVASGSITHEPNANSPEAAAAGLSPDTAIIPEVRYFAGNQVNFAEVPWAVGGAPEWRAFIWQLDGNSVQPDTEGRWGKSGISRLETMGELAWLDADPNLPAMESNSPIPAFNVVRLVDQGGERVIYTTGEWILADTEYINGGAQLALLEMAPFDEETAANPPSRWVALGRDDSVSEIMSGSPAFSQISDAPGGFVLFEMFFDESSSSFSYELSRFEGSSESLLWQAEGMGWELVGTAAVPRQTGLSPFPPAS